MKNIAVFAYNFAVEYTASVLKGIYRFFEGRDDVRVFYTQTKLPNIEAGFFEYQYWAAAEFLKSNSIDEIILVANSYFYYMPAEKFLNVIKPFCEKKIISIGYDLLDKNTYYTDTDCHASFSEIVKHMKEVHGCKRFAFFSANPIGSTEALLRYEAFKNALKENDLEFDEKRVFDGYFTSSSANAELKKRIKSRDDIDFDVLICANDLMAVGCVDFFIAMGVSIPDELKITGFDNTSHASLCNPSLTTIDPAIEQQGYDAAALSLRLLNGDSSDRRVLTSLKIKYRRSCGCNPSMEGGNMDTYRNLLAYYDDISNIDFLFDFVRGTSSFEEIASSLVSIGYMFGFSTVTACMYDEPVPFAREDSIVVQNSVQLAMHLNFDTKEIIIPEDAEVFDPHDHLIPLDLQKTDFSKGGQYILQPIFLGQRQYGYAVYRLRRPAFAVNGIVLKILNNAIAQGFDYSRTVRRAKNLDTVNQSLTSHNIDLKIRSSTDELTGLLNRRGFLTNAQKIVTLATEIGLKGLVCFADLDGLKKINDNYGHDYGDIAIKLQAKVLKEAFRKTDVVGRLSGDEFGIVAVDVDASFVETLRSEIEELDAKYTKENNLPFELSVSLGAVPFDESITDLAELLKRADADLYTQKEIHHEKMSKA